LYQQIIIVIISIYNSCCII